MDNNTNLAETKSPINKKQIALIILICLIVGGTLWYFLYYTKTPTYSLNLIRISIQNHDVATFKKHVDLDSLLSRGFDDLMANAGESDPQIKNNPFAAGLINMLKPMAISAFKDGITRYIETGEWQENHSASNNNSPNMDAMENKTGIKSASFKGIEYTKKDGKIATVGIKIFDNDLNDNFIIDIQMRELDDGTWQVAGISNLKDYFSAINKAQTVNLKKYIEDTKPIVDSHNKNLIEMHNRINSIAKSTEENKNEELKNIIKNELIPDFNSRIEELNKIAVPPSAKELHQLRIKTSSLTIQQFTKYMEWLDTKNSQADSEYKDLARQAKATNQQVLSIIAKTNNH